MTEDERDEVAMLAKRVLADPGATDYEIARAIDVLRRAGVDVPIPAMSISDRLTLLAVGVCAMAALGLAVMM